MEHVTGEGHDAEGAAAKTCAGGPSCYKCQIPPPRNVGNDSFLIKVLATTISSIAFREMEKGTALSTSPPRIF